MSKEIQVLPFSFFSEKSKRGEVVDVDESCCNVDTPLINEELSLETLNLPSDIETRLYEHQKSGVLWLYQCYLNQSGGLLGDDMGLGKTFQVTTLLCSLMRMGVIRRVLILCPVSVLESWRREISSHLIPYVKNSLVDIINADLSKKKRLDILHYIFSIKSPTIIISSYQLVSNMIESFTQERVWDYVILDEGHCIKNTTTKLSKSMSLLRSHHRLLLTGTPVQNNLEEFWCLINWVTKGSLLGTKTHFMTTYIQPILSGQHPKASVTVREHSRTIAQKLIHLIRPIFLQRKKDDFLTHTKLPDKVEITVWIPLSTTQRTLYEKYIKSRRMKDTLIQSTYPIAVINYLKTLCRHPLLVEASEIMTTYRLKIKQERMKKDYFTTHSTITTTTITRKNSAMNKTNKQNRVDHNVIQYYEDLSDGEFDIEEDNYNNNDNSNNTVRNKIPKNTHKTYDCTEDNKNDDNNDGDNSDWLVDGDDNDDNYDEDDLCNHVNSMTLHNGKVTTTNNTISHNCKKKSSNDRHITADSSLFDIINNREISYDDICTGSIKIRVLIQLIRRLHREGHRTLIFSQSKLMLDIIQRVLAEKGLSTVRIDGSVVGRERQHIIDSFNQNGQHSSNNKNRDNESDNDDNSTSDNSNGGPSICLLTTKACGVGITLTGADRVIIYDPSWNPAEDRQAVDRAYRIGQTKDVIVYRFIMASTVEEKMYEKQVFKDGLRVVTEKGTSSKYIVSDEETRNLFELGMPDTCEILTKLPISCHLKEQYISQCTYGPLDRVLGYSRHDTVYDEKSDRNKNNNTKNSNMLSTLPPKKVTSNDLHVSNKCINKSYDNKMEMTKMSKKKSSAIDVIDVDDIIDEFTHIKIHDNTKMPFPILNTNSMINTKNTDVILLDNHSSRLGADAYNNSRHSEGSSSLAFSYTNDTSTVISIKKDNTTSSISSGALCSDNLSNNIKQDTYKRIPKKKDFINLSAEDDIHVHVQDESAAESKVQPVSSTTSNSPSISSEIYHKQSNTTTNNINIPISASHAEGTDTSIYSISISPKSMRKSSNSKLKQPIKQIKKNRFIIDSDDDDEEEEDNDNNKDNIVHCKDDRNTKIEIRKEFTNNTIRLSSYSEGHISNIHIPTPVQNHEVSNNVNDINSAYDQQTTTINTPNNGKGKPNTSTSTPKLVQLSGLYSSLYTTYMNDYTNDSITDISPLTVVSPATALIHTPPHNKSKMSRYMYMQNNVQTGCKKPLLLHSELKPNLNSDDFHPDSGKVISKRITHTPEAVSAWSSSSSSSSSDASSSRYSSILDYDSCINHTNNDISPVSLHSYNDKHNSPKLLCITSQSSEIVSEASYQQINVATSNSGNIYINDNHTILEDNHIGRSNLPDKYFENIGITSSGMSKYSPPSDLYEKVSYDDEEEVDENDDDDDDDDFGLIDHRNTLIELQTILPGTNININSNTSINSHLRPIDDRVLMHSTDGVDVVTKCHRDHILKSSRKSNESNTTNSNQKSYISSTYTPKMIKKPSMSHNMRDIPLRTEDWIQIQTTQTPIHNTYISQYNVISPFSHIKEERKGERQGEGEVQLIKSNGENSYSDIDMMRMNITLYKDIHVHVYNHMTEILSHNIIQPDYSQSNSSIHDRFISPTTKSPSLNLGYIHKSVNKNDDSNNRVSVQSSYTSNTTTTISPYLKDLSLSSLSLIKSPSSVSYTPKSSRSNTSKILLSHKLSPQIQSSHMASYTQDTLYNQIPSNATNPNNATGGSITTCQNNLTENKVNRQAISISEMMSQHIISPPSLPETETGTSIHHHTPIISTSKLFQTSIRRKTFRSFCPLSESSADTNSTSSTYHHSIHNSSSSSSDHSSSINKSHTINTKDEYSANALLEIQPLHTHESRYSLNTVTMSPSGTVTNHDNIPMISPSNKNLMTFTSQHNKENDYTKMNHNNTRTSLNMMINSDNIVHSKKVSNYPVNTKLFDSPMTIKMTRLTLEETINKSKRLDCDSSSSSSSSSKDNRIILPIKPVVTTVNVIDLT